MMLTPNASTKEADTPKHHIGWLVTRLQKVNNGAYWTDKEKARRQKKRQEYKSKSKCLIPEYLDESFETKTLCGMCGCKCTRKKDN